MTSSLVVTSLAACALVAGVVSLMIWTGLPALDRAADRLEASARATLWLALAALPTVAGLLAVAASLLPAVGLGVDHCLDHGAHHPHLCPHHTGGAPGVALVLAAGFWASRSGYVALGLLRDLWLDHRAARALLDASDRFEDARVFPAETPRAFVLGTLRPRVHVSTGLLELDPRVVAPVLAHERAHVRRRDVATRLLQPALAIGHLPRVGQAIARRLMTAQELAADAEAARNWPDGSLRVAEALLALARFAPASAARGLAFTQGDLQARIRALVDEPSPGAPWPAWAATTATIAGMAGLIAAHDVIHHGLETVLGALS